MAERYEILHAPRMCRSASVIILCLPLGDRKKAGVGVYNIYRRHFLSFNLQLWFWSRSKAQGEPLILNQSSTRSWCRQICLKGEIVKIKIR